MTKEEAIHAQLVELQRDHQATLSEVCRLKAALTEIAEGYDWSGSNCRETAEAALAGIEQHAKIDAAVDDMVEKYPKTLDHLRRS